MATSALLFGAFTHTLASILVLFVSWETSNRLAFTLAAILIKVVARRAGLNLFALASTNRVIVPDIALVDFRAIAMVETFTLACLFIEEGKWGCAFAFVLILNNCEDHCCRGVLTGVCNANFNSIDTALQTIEFELINLCIVIPFEDFASIDTCFKFIITCNNQSCILFAINIEC